jgi:hypothetical protein
MGPRSANEFLKAAKRTDEKALALSDQLSDIRDACIKANPEIECRYAHGGFPPPGESVCKCEVRPIRLADVLLASQKNMFAIQTLLDGRLTAVGDDASSHVIWNLRKDDLTLQSNECLEFISSLLKA